MSHEEEQELFGGDEVSRQAKRDLLVGTPVRLPGDRVWAPEAQRREHEKYYQRLRESGLP